MSSIELQGGRDADRFTYQARQERGEPCKKWSNIFENFSGENIVSIYECSTVVVYACKCWEYALLRMEKTTPCFSESDSPRIEVQSYVGEHSWDYRVRETNEHTVLGNCPVFKA